MQQTSEKRRPVFLSLSPANFHWPVTAIASILHRLTGVALFFGIGLLLWLLDLALSSPDGFIAAESILAAPLAKLVLWGVLVMLIYHLIAGIKHLLLDFHVGDTFIGSSIAAYVVFVITAILAAMTGAWLWL